MRSDGSRIAGKAERTADRVRVPFSGHVPLGEFLQDLMEQVKEKHLAAYAGNIAYRSLFAVFPSLISFLWLLTVLHGAALAHALVGLASTALPDTASGVIRQQLGAVPSAHANANFTLPALISLVVALWAASASFRATMEALNVIYAVDEKRAAWRRYIISFLLSLASMLLLVGALALVVFGSGIAQKLAGVTGQQLMFRVVWLGVLWLVLLGLVLSAFSLVYYFAPDVQERFRWISRGSLAGLVLWVLFTWLFAFYINHAVNYTETYGALSGIAVLMIYVYAVSFILLLGAEINRILEVDHPRPEPARQTHPGGQPRGESVATAGGAER